LGSRRPWDSCGANGRIAADLYRAKLPGLQEMCGMRLVEWLMCHPVVLEDNALLTVLQKAAATLPLMNLEERQKWEGGSASWWPLATYRDLPTLLRPPSLKLGAQIKLRHLIADSFRIIELTEVMIRTVD